MEFSLIRSLQILERTPAVLRSWLQGLDDDWIYADEGPQTFSPFDVLGHLIHGERTDWMPRLKIILESSQEPFPSFDRFAMYRESQGKGLEELLSTFESLRQENLARLRSRNLDQEQLDRIGAHPELGPVSLRQLLATWTAHDLGHLAQIARTQMIQYREAVGPWRRYLKLLG